MINRANFSCQFNKLTITLCIQNTKGLPDETGFFTCRFFVINFSFSSTDKAFSSFTGVSDPFTRLAILLLNNVKLFSCRKSFLSQEKHDMPIIRLNLSTKRSLRPAPLKIGLLNFLFKIEVHETFDL